MKFWLPIFFLCPTLLAAQLLNGSFETPAGPSLEHWSGPCNLGAVAEGGAPGAGDWLLQLPPGNFQGCFPGFYYQDIPAADGAYQLTGWVRGSNDQRPRTLALGVRSAGGAWTVIAQDTSSAAEWQKLSIQGVVSLTPGDTAAVLLDPGSTTGPQQAGDLAFFDGIALEEVTAAETIAADRQLRIFPNPVAGNALFLVNRNLEVSKVTLFTAAGQVLPLPSYPGAALDVSGLPPGQYWLSFATNAGRLLRSFIRL